MAALVGITPDLRAIFAAHVAFQLVDWRGLGTPDDVKRHSLMRVAAKAFDFEIEIASVERVTQGWGRLGGSLKAKHASVPSLTGEPVLCIYGRGEAALSARGVSKETPQRRADALRPP
jgi:hypothetical protein